MCVFLLLFCCFVLFFVTFRGIDERLFHCEPLPLESADPDVLLSSQTFFTDMPPIMNYSFQHEYRSNTDEYRCLLTAKFCPPELGGYKTQTRPDQTRPDQPRACVPTVKVYTPDNQTKMLVIQRNMFFPKL